MSTVPTCRDESALRREKRRAPLFEVIGDDHPDQPRFNGGLILVVLVVCALWAVAGLLIWWATR